MSEIALRGLRESMGFDHIMGMKHPIRIRSVLLIAGALVAMCAAATDVYRWTDADGEVHYGSRAPTDATLLFRTQPRVVAPEGAQRRKVEIARVIDGDTVVLTTGQRLRLAGINAPEVAVAGKPGQPGGQDARSRLVDLVKPGGLSLEVAVEPADRYGRSLGYLFDSEDKDIALTLLDEGLVFAAVHPPNVAYADAYMAAETPAREARRGLWALPEFDVVEPGMLTDAGNQFRRVKLVVSGLERDGTDDVLRDSRGFELRIPREAAGDFPQRSQLLSRTLVVRGFLRSHRGKPYLPLVHPSQIESRE
ncbi:MAG: thermonuclease family protein [Gammaproteobacteria bacterium]|nr:thermonuclease family protein [Gammaproteobacteria bacterium]MCP5137938.1 thermonuclease family protein [Gammaproteobacteria bacterium]